MQVQSSTDWLAEAEEVVFDVHVVHAALPVVFLNFPSAH